MSSELPQQIEHLLESVSSKRARIVIKHIHLLRIPPVKLWSKPVDFHWLTAARRLAALALLSLVLAACTPATPAFTPTPTRTPVPTWTPTPLPPTPTPTPAFPVTAGCAEGVPAGACARFQALIAGDPAHFAWLGTPVADVILGRADTPQGVSVGAWTYAVAAPFYTIDDEVTLADLRATWGGTPAGPFATHPLFATPDTIGALTALLGPPAADALREVEATALLSEAEAADGWAIVPFDELNVHWKVLRLDGLSLLEKGLPADAYPLQLPLAVGSAHRAETLPLLALTPATLANRDESRLTIVAMTGVTAMTRAFASWMETQGNTYAAQDIQSWLASADFTHISNEVSFKPDCVPEPSGTMSFCSHDKYIELLEYVGTDIVELTGNHLADKGLDPLRHTLELYRARGWRWYGGGENLADATRPLTITQGPNRIAFLGCNPIGPSYDWATAEEPGSAPCDYELMLTQIAQLRAEGYQPIVTLQYLETEQYFPTPQQVRDFRMFADAGAVVMQGSQAHQAQTFELYGDTFIAYGMGNLFFDQNWLEAWPDYINRLAFYDNRLLSVDIRTTMMIRNDYGRRRPMTPEERREFLQMMLNFRPGQ